MAGDNHFFFLVNQANIIKKREVPLSTHEVYTRNTKKNKVK
jgi:hypothetical protein